MRPLACTLCCALAAVLAACDSFTVCSTSVEPSLLVVVQDSVDGSDQMDGATAVAADGSFRYALVPYHQPVTGLRTLAGPFERKGTYAVTVEKPGYAAWRREAVRVGEDECHVRTVTLTARLQPAGP